MAREFKEVAHRKYIGNKVYHDNYDSIDWGNHGKKESGEESKQETNSVDANTKEKQNVRTNDEEIN